MIVHNGAALEDQDLYNITSKMPHLKQVVLKNAPKLSDRTIRGLIEICKDTKYVALGGAPAVVQFGRVQLLSLAGSLHANER